MQIHLYANLRQLAGQKTIELDIDEPLSAAQFINTLVARFPKMGPALLNDAGQISEHVRLFVNGRDAQTISDPQRLLLPADARIDLFPAIAGGGVRRCLPIHA